MDTLIVRVKQGDPFEGLLSMAGQCGLIMRSPVVYLKDLDECLVVFGEEPDAMAYLLSDGTVRSSYLALQTIASSIEFQCFMAPDQFTSVLYIRR